jgi:hypothetical protein
MDDSALTSRAVQSVAPCYLADHSRAISAEPDRQSYDPSSSSREMVLLGKQPVTTPQPIVTEPDEYGCSVLAGSAVDHQSGQFIQQTIENISASRRLGEKMGNPEKELQQFIDICQAMVLKQHEIIEKKYDLILTQDSRCSSAKKEQIKLQRFHSGNAIALVENVRLAAKHMLHAKESLPIHLLPRLNLGIQDIEEEKKFIESRLPVKYKVLIGALLLACVITPFLTLLGSFLGLLSFLPFTVELSHILLAATLPIGALAGLAINLPNFRNDADYREYEDTHILIKDYDSLISAFKEILKKMETGFSARAATAAEEGVKATLVSFVKTNEALTGAREATHNIVKSTEQKLTERINALEEQLKKQAEKREQDKQEILAAIQALSASPPKATDLA